ncbi:MAG: restriction endonuclease subunit S, partial [Methanobacteriaceae archaeon]|nr:restriction endonuclease subunit S [Methanobacteriaceae archaeon]
MNKLNNWSEKELIKLLINIESGSRPSGGVSLDSGTIPSFGGENIIQSGGISYYPVKKISNTFFKSLKKGILKDKDVLINKDGANTGKCGIYSSKHYKRAAINEHLFILRPHNEKITPEYLYYYLTFEKGQKKIKDKITGSAQPGINSKFVKNFYIKLPKSIQEQQKIASILENVDNIIDKTQEIIEKYEMMKQGLMHDLFTKGIDENGKAHTEFKDSVLGEIPNNWDVKPLKDLIEIEHGYAFKGEYFTDQLTDYILLTPGNFHIKGDLYFNERNIKYYSGSFPPKYILKNGDLLTVMTDLTKEMAILGNTVILESKYNILHNQRIGKIIIKDPKNIFDKYILTLMNTHYCKDEIQKTATGTTVRHTAPERIYNALVPICSYEEQKRIANLLLSIEKRIQTEYKYSN